MIPRPDSLVESAMLSLIAPHYAHLSGPARDQAICSAMARKFADLAERWQAPVAEGPGEAVIASGAPRSPEEALSNRELPIGSFAKTGRSEVLA